MAPDIAIDDFNKCNAYFLNHIATLWLDNIALKNSKYNVFLV